MKKQIKPMDIDKFYAVLVALYLEDDSWYLVLEKRAENISQPKEISFAGGKIESGEDAIAAAIRETCEELGLDEEEIKIIEEMDYVITPFNTCIYPIIGEIQRFPSDINKAEVSEVIKIPLKYFLECEAEEYISDITMNFTEDFPFEKIMGGRNYPWKMGTYKILFYEYNDIIIWGITAKIIQDFICKNAKKYNK